MGKSRKKLYADIENSKLDEDNKESNEGKQANKLRQQTELHKPIRGMSQYERTNAYAELAKRHKAKQSAGKRRRNKNKSVKRKNRKTRRKRGGETDEEIRQRRRNERADKKLDAIERGKYIRPDNRGQIVNQNLDIHKLNTHYNDDMNFASAEADGLTFGGKKSKKKKTRVKLAFK
jgi:hypothetical protein